MNSPGFPILCLQRAGVFLLILGVKLWLIFSFGNSTPFWDEWNSISHLSDFNGGSESIMGHLFATHNEHRIVFTRLLALSALHLNAGIWDPMVLMVLQAFLHAAVLCLLIRFLSIGLRPALRSIFIAFTLLLVLVPFGWENLLWGFQSHVYFQTLFALLCLGFYWKYETVSAGWWLAMLFALLGLFTMAGGVFAPLVCALLALTRLFRSESQKVEIMGLAVILLVLALGLALFYSAPGNERLFASSISSFFSAFLKACSWPFRVEWMAWLTLLPAAGLAWQWIREKPPARSPGWLLLALVLYAFVQTTATAYGRAQDVFSFRYADHYILALCCSFACLCRICDSSSGSFRKAVMGFGLAWVLLVLGGLTRELVTNTIPYIEARAGQGKSQERNVQAYISSGNPVHLSGPILLEVPYPKRERLQAWLDTPAIRNALAVDLRPSLQPVQPLAPGPGFALDPRGGPETNRPRVEIYTSRGDGRMDSPAKLLLNFSGDRQSNLLRFFLSGHPRADGIAFFLTDSKGQRHDLARFNPGDRWRAFVLRIPPGPFFIEADNRHSGLDFAFTLPKETGELSLAAAYLSRRGAWVALAGLLCLMTLFLPSQKSSSC